MKLALRFLDCARLALSLSVVVGCEGTLDAGHDAPTLAVPTPMMTSTPDAGRGVPTPSVAEPSDAGTSPGPTTPPSVAPDASDPPVLDSGGEVDWPLPISAENPILLVNDNPTDNWFGELALLAASAGRINLVGVVVNASAYWPDIERNQGLWQDLVDAARASGLQNVPELVVGASQPLAAPEDGNVDATVPNASAGAQFIMTAAATFGTPELPLVVISGSTLTDIADAYLLDPSIAQRVVAVGAMGWSRDEGAVMGGPNGELDTWAGNIVAQRVPFVQVSAFYEHAEDVPEARVGELPQNAFGSWMEAKRGQIDNPYAADQVALLSVISPDFALDVQRVGYAGLNPQGEAVLNFEQEGCCWFVLECDGSQAAELLWSMLGDPDTFAP